METNVEQKNELVIVVDQSGLEKETANMLLEKFTPFFNQAEEWKQKAEALVVTDATQLREIKQAREARLALKSLRTGADKVRKELKEDSLRYGRTVQGIYNVIEGLISPIEKHLEEQEKFAEIAEANRLAALKEQRITMLSPYGIQTEFYQLDIMSEPAFQQLLNSTIKNHQEQIEAERKANEERIAREQEALKEQERIRLENEELKRKALEREKEVAAKNQLRLERQVILQKYGCHTSTDVAELTEEQFEASLAQIKEAWEIDEKNRIRQEEEESRAREQREEELRKEREEAQAKIQAERKERERVEAELRAKQEAEAKAKADAEAKAESELSKGDKEKFNDLIQELEAVKKKYSFRSKKYKALSESVNELLNKTINWAVSKQ